MFAGLSTALNLITFEAKYPLESKNNPENTFPLGKFKALVMKILSSKQNTAHLINKFEEYLIYDDILCYTWKILPSLTAKSNPSDIYIMNYLLLLGKMHVEKNSETKVLCCVDEGNLNIIISNHTLI